MNEELQNALVEFVAMITSAAQTAAEFGADQLPDVIEQLLAWTFWSSAAWAVFWWGFVIVVIAANVHVIRLRKRDMDNGGGVFWSRLGEPEGAIPVFIASIIGGGMLAAVAIGFGMTALKIAIAPKVWLIEYAASLAK